MNFQVVRTYLFGFMPCIPIETFGSRCTGSLLQLLLAMPRCHGPQKLRTTCTAWASRRIKSWGLNEALSSWWSLSQIFNHQRWMVYCSKSTRTDDWLQWQQLINNHPQISGLLNGPSLSMGDMSWLPLQELCCFPSSNKSGGGRHGSIVAQRSGAFP